MSVEAKALHTESEQANGHVVVAGRPMPEFRHIGVEPLTGACGCEITGVDLRKPLPDEVLREVMAAFEHFLVIMLRDQELSIDEHKAFSHYFGELMELPQAPLYAGDREMQEVRREVHDPVSVVPFTKFHTDSPFLQRPPKCMVMRAIDAPRYGGDTAFANMYLAYEELSDGMKKMLEELRVVYSGKDIWSKNAKLDKDKQLRLRESHDFKEDQLENAHPAVRRHPTTGRKALYVTAAYFRHFEGWSAEDSRPLLEYFAHMPHKLQYQCRIRWKPNTVIVWDNRFLQHCGIHDYENERRHLVRTTVIGERPI
ncbi:MAG: TauD/TfdA dioxygenase family protein [Candidatus Acidiferrales bacterium]